MEKTIGIYFSVVMVFLGSCGYGGAGLYEDINRQLDSRLEAEFSIVFENEMPLEVRFLDISRGEISKWYWDLEGDGIIDKVHEGSSVSFTHLYNACGAYSPRLVIESEDKRISTYTLEDIIKVEK